MAEINLLILIITLSFKSNLKCVRKSNYICRRCVVVILAASTIITSSLTASVNPSLDI